MIKAYPEYKESGINWLGEVPSHWLLSKNKFLAKFTKGKNPTELHDDKAPSLYPYLAMDFLRGKNNSPKYAHLEKSSYLVKDGQNLIIWDGSNAGEFVVGKEGILSSTMAAGELSNKVTAKFYKYLTTIIEKEMRRLTVGMGIPHVDGSELNNLSLPLPESFQEQEKIADYLDMEVGRVDNLISEKENFIKLLSEKRQALISHVVTKGLNPNVPMKDSGVEWIGEIPEHWVIEKVKHSLNSVESGTSVNSEGVPASEGKLGVLKTSCVSNGFFEPEENKQVLEEDIKRVSCPVKENRLIVSRMNTPELVGAAAYTDSSYSYLFLPDRLWQIEFENRVNTKFIYYWTLTNSYRDQIKSVCVGTSSSMQNLSQEDFKNFKLPVPKLSVQNDIVAYIERSTEKIRLLKEETVKSIELLKEHRTALISAAVTGKIDVREEV